ncbi:MAG: hypothetical protein ACRC6V_01135 [Bacteroidales bacterium]
MTTEAVYHNQLYKVVPNEAKTGYDIVNKFTGVREGGSEKLPSAVSQADVSNELLLEIIRRDQPCES